MTSSARSSSATPTSPADSLPEAFDAEAFRRDGHRVIDLLADYLARARAGEGAVLPACPPGEMAARWPGRFPEEPSGDIGALLESVIAQSNHLHHPHYAGHQVSSPLPRSALLELACALLNNGSGVFEMGPASTAMERAAIRWMAGRLGLGPRSDGFLTSGGSAGNLTALLAARAAKAGFDVWERGSHSGPRLVVLTSSQAHYSVKRAVQVMGWGEGGAVSIPVDRRLRMDPRALEPAFRKASRTRRVIAVSASACSTAAGAYDPLEPIADFCERRGLWLHVDGAHGASAALTSEHRALLDGIERADSVVWDAHKMMMLPSLITAVIFKDGARSYEAFSQEASYLLSGKPREEWFNLAHRTLECTKRMMGVTLYAALSLHGTRVFAENVRRTYALARRFAAMIRSRPDFELALEPQGNIVCFRHLGARGAPALDRLQKDIRRRVLEGERFYLVQTELPTGVFLRCALMNPMTTEADLSALLDEVRAAASRTAARQARNGAAVDMRRAK